MREASICKSSNFSQIGVLLLLLIATISLISCSSSLDAHRARMAGPSALETGHWTKVRTNPPTYFPKGVPADHPTDYHNGYWVRPGGAHGNQFFIPNRGHGKLSEKQLIAEAWAAAAPSERARLEEEARREDHRKIAASPLILIRYGAHVWDDL